MKIYTSPFNPVPQNNIFEYVGSTVVNALKIDCYYGWSKFLVVTQVESVQGTNVVAYPLLNIGFQIALEQELFSEVELEQFATKFDEILSNKTRTVTIKKRFAKASVDFFDYSHETYDVTYQVHLTTQIKVRKDVEDMSKEIWNIDIPENANTSFEENSFKPIRITKRST